MYETEKVKGGSRFGETGRLGEKETWRRRLFFNYLNPNLTGGWISRLKEKGKRLK
jgi:hypothetical protein